MRALLLTPTFFPEIGGQETLVYQVAQELVRKDGGVLVVTFTERRDLPLEEQLGNIRVRRILVQPSRIPNLLPRRLFLRLVDRVIYRTTRLGRVFALLSELMVNGGENLNCHSVMVLKSVMRAILMEQPDVVHIFDPRVGVAIYPITLFVRTPVIVTYPGSFWRRNSTTRCFEKLCYCVSYDHYAMHEDGTRAEGIARHMGVVEVSSFFSTVDAGVFDPTTVSRSASRASLGLVASDFVVGAPGRIKNVKGTREIVEGFVKSARKDDVLLLAGEVGDPAYYKSIQEMTDGSAKRPRVRFLGSLEHSRMARFMAACDAIVLNGELSNLNMTFAEALMMGRPCVVRNLGLDRISRELGQCQNVLLTDGSPEGIGLSLDTIRDRTAPEDFYFDETHLARRLFTSESVGKHMRDVYCGAILRRDKNSR